LLYVLPAMLRITVHRESEPPIVRVKIEGRLLGETMDQLTTELETLGLQSEHVVVDLTAVPFADETALARLRELPRRGVELGSASPFLRELLAGDARDDGGSAKGRAKPVASKRAAKASTVASVSVVDHVVGADDPDEAALVRALRARDEAAYELMIRRYGARLLATAMRLMKREDDAADVVQEAYLSAFRAIDRFSGDSRLSTWLHRIVVNAALMRLRSKRRRREESIEDLLPRFDETGHFAEPPSDWGASADRLLERKDTCATVRAAIAKLPESYRTVLVLRDVEELDTEEVAQTLGLTTNAVKVRLHRARQALRTLIEKEMTVGG
jgi:RNA polymerase sigma-70 factor (ECF subfamily)